MSWGGGGGGLTSRGAYKNMWYKKLFPNELIRNKLRLTKSIIKMRFPFNRL